MRRERILTRVELRPKGEIQGCISSNPDLPASRTSSATQSTCSDQLQTPISGVHIMSFPLWLAAAST